jgi:hypothetical protein
MKSKDEKAIKLAASITLYEFNVHGHVIKKGRTDDEAVLKTMGKSLGSYGISFATTPSGLHEKDMERGGYQTVKNRKRAVWAQLRSL